jgi:hypothetical protein
MYRTIDVCTPSFCSVVKFLPTLDFVDFLMGDSHHTMKDRTRKELIEELDMLSRTGVKERHTLDVIQT